MTNGLAIMRIATLAADCPELQPPGRDVGEKPTLWLCDTRKENEIYSQLSAQYGSDMAVRVMTQV